MHSKTVNELSKYVDKDFKSKGAEWLLWCRLCAKEDRVGNISVFFNDEQTSSTASTSITTWKGNSVNNDLSLPAAIGKYFWVNITRDEELPKMLCTECFSLVTALRNFSERVTKVQQMYAVLLNTKDLKSLELQSIRKKYGLLDEEREHVMTQLRLPEFHYFETKPKLTDCAEDEQVQDTVDDGNPLESAGTNLNIKKEFCVVYNEELIQNNDVYDENESLSNDRMQETLISNEVNIDEISNDADDVLSVEKCNKNEVKYDADDDGVDKNVGRRLLRKTKRNVKKKLILDESSHDEKDSNRSGTFLCSKCPRKFKREQNLKNHLDRNHDVHNSNYPCTQCQRVFNRRSNLERHSTVHLPLASRKVLPCPHCSKKFMANTLQSHIRYMHTQELRINRQLICEECGISVRTNASLKEHLLTHTDYAPFECEVCKKGFKSQSRLKLHMEIHDPNKHICAECGLQLNSRVTLNRHLLVHSDEMQHKCDYCGRAFKRAKALKNHLILHTGLKPYSCDFCDRTFANGANCRTHKKKSHPEELAALEAAGGGKTYTRNIPKLEALKAVTKTAENLAPVVSKQSGRFAFGKKPKPPDDAKDVKTSNSKNNKNVMTSSNESTASACIPTIDNIYTHLMKQTSIINEQATDKQDLTQDNNIQNGHRECVNNSNASREQFQLEQNQSFESQQNTLHILATPQQNHITIKSSGSPNSQCSPHISDEHSNASSSINFYDSIKPNLQQLQHNPTQYL